MKEKSDPNRKKGLEQSPAAKPGAPGHDEWLVDEAVEETFPASDPVAPKHPGEDPAKPARPGKKK